MPAKEAQVALRLHLQGIYSESVFICCLNILERYLLPFAMSKVLGDPWYNFIFLFEGMSTFVGHLMPKISLLKNSSDII